MGNGPVTEWVARLEKPEQAYTAAVLRDDALRVGTRVAAKRVAMVLEVGARPGVFAQVATGMDSKPPTTLRGGSACRAMLATNRPIAGHTTCANACGQLRGHEPVGRRQAYREGLRVL